MQQTKKDTQALISFNSSKDETHVGGGGGGGGGTIPLLFAVRFSSSL